MTIHDLDLARFLIADEVGEVSAMGAVLGAQGPAFQRAGDWDTTVLNLRFAGGALGSIVNSRQAGYGYDIHTEVLGSRGALKVGYERHTPLTRYGPEGARHDYVPYFPQRFAEAYRAEIEAFVLAVQEGRPVTPDGEDGLAALKVALGGDRIGPPGRGPRPGRQRLSVAQESPRAPRASRSNTCCSSSTGTGGVSSPPGCR